MYTVMVFMLLVIKSGYVWSYIQKETEAIDSLNYLLEGVIVAIHSSVVTITVISDQFTDISTHFLLSLHSSSASIRIANVSLFSSKINLIYIKNHSNNIFLQKKNTFWDPVNYYFIYFRDPFRQDIWTTLLLHLWTIFQVYNVFLISHDKCVISFNPCTSEFEEMTLKNITEQGILGRRFNDWKGSTLYYVKAREQDHIDEGLIKTGSYDENIINVISEKLNVRPILLPTLDNETYGWRDENGTYRGTFKNLLARTSNMTVNGHFLRYNGIVEGLSFSHYFSLEKLCFAVPSAERMTRVMAMYKSLNLWMWLLIFVSYTATGTVYVVLRWLVTKKHIKQSLVSSDIFLMMLGFVLGFSVPMKPKMFFEKFQITSIILMSFIIVNIIQSTLMTILSAPTYYKPLESKEEIATSGIEIWSSSHGIVDTLKDSGFDRVNFRLVKPGTSSQGHKVGWLEKINVMLSTRYMKYSDVGNRITQECPVTFCTAYFFSRGFPSENQINTIISSLIDSGIIKKWLKDFYSGHHKSLTYLKTKHFLVPETNALKIEDLKLVFHFVCIALILCMCIFISELIIQTITPVSKKVKLPHKVFVRSKLKV